jgi:hypothetical protein
MDLILWLLVYALCALLVIIVRLMVCTSDPSGPEEHAIVPVPFSEWIRVGTDRACLRVDLVRNGHGPV